MNVYQYCSESCDDFLRCPVEVAGQILASAARGRLRAGLLVIQRCVHLLIILPSRSGHDIRMSRLVLLLLLLVDIRVPDVARRDFIGDEGRALHDAGVAVVDDAGIIHHSGAVGVDKSLIDLRDAVVEDWSNFRSHLLFVFARHFGI